MAMVLCLDDFTCGLAEAAQVLRDNGYAVLAADDNASALEIAYATHVDAVLLARAAAAGGGMSEPVWILPRREITVKLSEVQSWHDGQNVSRWARSCLFSH